MELKEYTIVMVRSKNQTLVNGKFVKDTTLYKGRADTDPAYGYLVNVEDKHNIEISYSYDGRALCCIDLYCKDKDTLLEVVEPYLISSDDILENELCYVEGVVMKANMNHTNPLVCKKIVATPEELAWVYYEGSPHDRAYDYKNGTYLEILHPSVILEIIDNGGKILVDVKEICPNYNGSHIGRDCNCKMGFIHIPKLHEGKVIFHHYELTTKELYNYLIIR